MEVQRGYSRGELMVAAASREIRDGEMVFVGMRLPLLAFLVAKKTHAPGAIGLYENGVMREEPLEQMLYTMGDPANLRGALSCGPMIDVMGLLQQGRVDVGFLGAAEIDRFGNLNSTWGSGKDGAVRLPGSGGACDIACLARRTVVLLEHAKHRMSQRVAHVTSPGYGSGEGWRSAEGLPEGTGPSAVITTMGVLRFGADGEAYLASVHPGVSVEEVKENTGWPLRVAMLLGETDAPSGEELEAMLVIDPQGFWTRG